MYSGIVLLKISILAFSEESCFQIRGNQEFLHKACQHSQLKSQSHEQNFVFRKSVCRQFAVIVAKLF